MKLHYEINESDVTIALYNGDKWSDEGREIVKEVSFNVADVPASLETSDGAKSLASYGLAKILQDRTSQIKDSVEEKFDAMSEVFALLVAGKWREYKEGGTRRATIDPLLAAAIAKLKKTDIVTATNALQAMPADDRKALAQLDSVKGVMQKMKDASAEALDLSDL